MYLYLGLALFWGVLGVAWLVWHWIDPQAQEPLMRWTSIPAGWFALALAGYNLLRWWSRRMQLEQDRAWSERPAAGGSRRSARRDQGDAI